MSTMQVNITTQVNSASIRRETHNGREHLVLPSYTLPANVVMNGGLYPASEIDKHYMGLEGTLAPLGHPMVDGQFVSAFSAEALNTSHVGAWNRNVKKSGSRVFVEKWLDIDVASRHPDGQRLIDRIEAIERGDDVPPIHTSVAVFLERMEANEDQKQAGAEWVAKIESVDHDAILLDEPGAATPEQGVGLMVNADLAKPLKVNAGVLSGPSFRDRERALDFAARQRFVSGTEDYVWVADFTDTQAIVIVSGGDAKVYNYTVDNGKVVFSDEGEDVVRQESWVSPIVNGLKKIFTNHQARPDNNQKESDMPLTTEEKADLVKQISEAITANVDAKLNPISDKLSTMEANHLALSETLTANAKAEEAEKRKAVEAKFGKDVADNLQGNALDALYKQCGDAAPIVNGRVGGGEEPKFDAVPE